jgi:hypothetical protein
MRLYYFFEALFTTDWTDIGVNQPFENHAINVASPLIEFAPLGLILDVQETIQLLLILAFWRGALRFNS